MAEMKRSRLAVPLVFVLVIIAVVAIVTGFTFGPVEALCVALAGVIWLFIQNLFFLFLCFYKNLFCLLFCFFN